jgi:histidyl-tRNA synthetase
MFRYERPQKGRLREFHQFGCESFGETNVYEDANIIIMISQILDFFKIGYKLQLNSLGCKDCMPSYKEKLVSNLKELNLCEDCNRRILTNPIRVLDCKNENCQAQLTNVPKITNNLCQTCDDDFEQLKKILDKNNISYEVDTNLVRGLDYYTKTAFEFVSDKIGAQSAIAGGGRYDRLVEFLGGRSTSAIGFAIGIERLLELIELEQIDEEVLYIGAMDTLALDTVFELVASKRKEIKVLSDYRSRGFTKHLTNATKQGATKVALIGTKELEDGTIWVKDIASNKEMTVDLEEF